MSSGPTSSRATAACMAGAHKSSPRSPAGRSQPEDSCNNLFRSSDGMARRPLQKRNTKKKKITNGSSLQQLLTPSWISLRFGLPCRVFYPKRVSSTEASRNEISRLDYEPVLRHQNKLGSPRKIGMELEESQPCLVIERSRFQGRAELAAGHIVGLPG